MRISDMLGQYNRNISNSTEELRNAQSVGKLVSAVGELEAGSIFEGTVSSVKNGRVTLALSNGQMISARLDGKVSLHEGDSMFFQVRSNDGTTVSIKPYMTESGGNNPILLNALSAAGIPATERSVAMVDAMMREQMSIGKQGLLDMARVLNNHPDVNVSTLVQMTKIGLPVSAEMAAQFEAYMANQHAILGEVEQAIGQLAQILGSETLPAPEAFLLYSQVLDILQQGGEPAFPAENPVAGEGIGNMAGGENAPVKEGVLEELPQNAGMDGGKAPAAAGGIPEGDAAADGALRTAAGAPERQLAAPPQTLEQLLDGKQMENLKQLLQNIPTLAGNSEIFQNAGEGEMFVNTMLDEEVGQGMARLMAEDKAPMADTDLNKNLTASQFLNLVRDALKQNGQFGFSGVPKLFASREFQALLKNMVEEQWLLKPGELKEENKISQLYERMETQMKQMEHALRMAGVSESSFANTASEVRGSIEFMNQINQIYTYVQVPLKLTGQNASSELYVYTNKKNLRDPDAELTAFLHLDLENLGSTDVSVKMLRKNVITAFYIDNDDAYHLIEKHLPVLEKRLKNKGYTCSVSVSHEKKQVDFVEDFLQKDMPPAGTLHRYSFDVKA